MIKLLLGDKISNLVIWQLNSHENNFLSGVMFTKVYKQRTKSWWFINSHSIYIKMFYWCLFECHKTTYNSQTGSSHIDMFAEEDQLSIKLRSGIDKPLTDICNHHEKYFLIKYVTFHFWCIKNQAKVRRSFYLVL